MPSSWKIVAAVIAGASLASQADARLVRVPQNYTTVQAAINAAVTGDTVLISTGTYTGGLTISGKTITLAGPYVQTNNPNDIAATIIDGGAPILTIDTNVGAAMTLRGLTFRNGNYQVMTNAPWVSILNCRFVGGSGDQLSFTSSGGLVRDCFFDSSGDDGIDSDEASSPTVENCTFQNSGDDGIELRLHPYTGTTLEIVFRNNVFTGAHEDGLQLIDYAGASSRHFRIEHNVFVNCLKAGLGTMADGNSIENFLGAPMVEQAEVIGNTFSGNPYGLTGGDNMLVMNNIFMGSTQVGAKRLSVSSLMTYNAFWNNTTDWSGTNMNSATSWHENPMVSTTTWDLLAGSPCINAGKASLVWNGKTINAPSYSGSAPDLGAHETGSTVGVPDLPAPGELVLAPVRPNPSRDGFAVAFSLPGSEPARIDILDLQGRRIASHDLSGLGRASHVVTLPETRGLPNGVYLVRLSQAGRTWSTRAIVLK